MRIVLLTFVAVGGLVAATLWMSGSREAVAADKKGPKLVHNVFFALKERTPAGRQKLVDACKKYLEKHDGVVYFAAGVLAEDLKREVNDLDWDVGLHLVFDSQASHDKYQVAPLHEQFIKENKDTWKKVRVFDSLCD